MLQLFYIFTFPGVIMHEFAHQLMCLWCTVKVYRVSYFNLGNPAGSVKHAIPKKLWQSFCIAIGPFIINPGLAILCSRIAFTDTMTENKRYLLLWLAFAIGTHAFPSDPDFGNVLIKNREGLKVHSFFAYLAYPIVWSIRKLNQYRSLWVNVFYGVLLVVIGLWIH
jgi:hypothetical protein